VPESIRHYVYLAYTLALVVGAVISFWRGDTATGIGMLALVLPTGLAAANTTTKG